MSEHPAEKDAGDGDLLKRFLSALDCCGTCAGGVLARYAREKQAEAWEEGHSTCCDDVCFSDGNPYRATTPDQTRVHCPFCGAPGYDGEFCSNCNYEASVAPPGATQ